MFCAYMDRIATPLRHSKGSPRDHVWRVQRLRVPRANNFKPIRKRASRECGVFAMVGERGLGRREKPSHGFSYGGGWSRGKEHRSVVSGGSGNAGTPPVLSHSIASSRSASTTSTQSMFTSTLSSSVLLLPQSLPVREVGEFFLLFSLFPSTLVNF